MKLFGRTVALCAALVASLIVVPAAQADDPPGVYDIALTRGVYLPAGSMTATWRAVVPAGTQVTGTWCHLLIDGVEQGQAISCASGQAFSYDLGTVSGTPTATVQIEPQYWDPDRGEHGSVTGSTTTRIDAIPPTAGVSGFTMENGFDQAPPSMQPATAYRASLIWSDNIAVTGQSCWIDRILPAPTVTVKPVSCNGPGIGSHGGSALFTTPSSSGTYNFVVAVTDPVGHTAQAARSFKVDATPPVLTLTGPGDGGVTNANNISWTWTSDESATYACWIGHPGESPVLIGCSSPLAYNGAPEGAYQLQIKATDSYANSGISTYNFTIDRTRPTVTVASPTGAGPVVPGPIHVVVQSDEPATYLCSNDPAAPSPAYAACGSGAPSGSYDATYDGWSFGTHRIGVKAVDRAGNTSDPVVVTVTVAPPVTGSAVIGGVPRVGSLLSAAGTWTGGATTTYQWRRDGADIPGATTTSYLPTVDDLGRALTVRVVGSLSGYVTTTVDSGAVTIGAGALSSGAGRVTGKLKVGKRLTASAAPWSPGTTVRYQWYAGGRKIAGATRAQLALTKKLAGKRIKVVITGSRAGYASRTLTVSVRGIVRR